MCSPSARSAEALDSLGLEVPFADGREAEDRFYSGPSLNSLEETPFAEAFFNGPVPGEASLDEAGLAWNSETIPRHERNDFETGNESEAATGAWEAQWQLAPDDGREGPAFAGEEEAFETYDEAEDPKPTKPLDLKTAEYVMYEVMRLLISGDATGSDPDRAKTPQSWFRLYTPLFKEWHVIIHGTATAKGRTRLQGEALGAKVDAAFTMTKPILAVLKKRGGAKWKKLLRQSFYAPVAKFELEAIQTGPVTRTAPAVPPVTFALRPPQAVSTAQFFSVVADTESQPIPLQEHIGGAQVGWVKSGYVFSASQQDQRVVLWTGSLGVFFLRDGAIYAQSGAGFAHDIIYGSFVLAAQNALGSSIMAQLMVELALSFTPWGRVWDVVSAIKALTEKDWKGAALAALPGPAFELAAKTRAFRAIGRGAVIAAKFGKAIVQKGVKFIARGAYVLNGKLLRGFWLVGESSAGGAKNFRFLDEVTETIHDVPPAKARDYIICSQCRLPPSAERLARQAEVQDIMENLVANANYASRGKVLIKPKLIDDVVAAYGSEGGDVVRNILTAFETTKDAAKHASDTLEIAKTLSKIKSRHPRFRQIAVHQDAIDIFADLAAHPSTAWGAMFELEWAARHVDEIAAMGVPIYRKGWRGVGKGLDIMGKKGAAIELKNYRFTSQIYADDPARSVSSIANQAKLRLAFKDPAVTEVRFIFDSRTTMPREFRRMLEEELAALTNSSGRNVSFEFWPPLPKR